MKTKIKFPTIVINDGSSDPQRLELGRVTGICFDKSSKEFIYFEKMDDGKWRLTYTEKTIKDIKSVQSFVIDRTKTERATL